ncbi:hypothetical protein GCM10027598_48120 [Amycolatopsis oliviviridis]|uniref:Uncharacterized protein n=1 Tax=Amycolatopsis oliviviridis TaxID=1471590 RepID=A0ABQ3MHK1_9PSEU|nr:hypothetical protein GCM10017790_82960 [Amycolatopsis oliviviridis]
MVVPPPVRVERGPAERDDVGDEEVALGVGVLIDEGHAASDPFAVPVRYVRAAVADGPALGFAQARQAAQQ